MEQERKGAFWGVPGVIQLMLMIPVVDPGQVVAIHQIDPEQRGLRIRSDQYLAEQGPRYIQGRRGG